MKQFILLILVFSSFFSLAQQSRYGCLTVTSERGDKFFMYLNGVKINSKPESSIRVEKLFNVFYALKIEYDDASHYTITKDKLFVCNKKGELRDFVYDLIRDESEMKLVFKSMTQVNFDYVAPENMFVFDLSAMEKVDVSQEKQNKNNSVTALKKSLGDNDSLSHSGLPTSKKATGETNANVVNALVIMEPRNWVCKNEWPMWKAEYEIALKEISSEKSENQKLKMAKSLSGKNCLTTDQVFETAELLLDESDRLEFIKSAYNHTIDIKNSLKLLGLFTDDKIKSSFTYFISH